MFKEVVILAVIKKLKCPLVGVSREYVVPGRTEADSTV